MWRADEEVSNFFGNSFLLSLGNSVGVPAVLHDVREPTPGFLGRQFYCYRLDNLAHSCVLEVL